MNVQSAVLGLLFVMLAADLILTFGVIRRLREHTIRLSQLENPAAAVGLGEGEPVGDFTANATNGATLSVEDLRDTVTVMTFVATECHACEDQLDTIRARVDTATAGGGQAITVVVNVRGDREIADQLLADVAGIGTVVEEPFGGPMQVAFKVRRFPSFFVLGPDATVMATPGSAGEIPAVALRTTAATGS